MKICTYTTDRNHNGFNKLKSTCPSIIELENVINWNYYFYPKWLSFQQYVNSTNDNEIIMLVDAYDVVFINDRNESSIESKAKMVLLSNKGIVFNAEKGCYPLPELRDKYPKVNGPWKYLNAGCSIGYSSEWKKHLNIVVPRIEYEMDQSVWSKYFLESDSIGLDTECKVFQCYSFIEEGEFIYSDSCVINKQMNSHPVVWHGNGQTDLSPLDRYI